jgi:hypothetical protein
MNGLLMSGDSNGATVPDAVRAVPLLSSHRGFPLATDSWVSRDEGRSSPDLLAGHANLESVAVLEKPISLKLILCLGNCCD